MKAIKLVSVSLLAAFAFSSCSSDGDPSQKENEYVKSKRKEISLDAQAFKTNIELTDFEKNFTMDMVRFVDSGADMTSKNVIVSPLSAEMLFGMIANGVDENAQKGILEYLGVSDLESLNAYCSQMLTQLPECDNLANMKLANSLWISDDYKLGSAFSRTIGTSFSAEAFYQDFSNRKETADRINKWCEANTDNLIKDFIKEITPDCFAVMLNALYFSAPWADENFIDKKAIERKTFHGLTADSEVEMMKGYLPEGLRIADDRFEGCSLPFGNSAFSLNIIMPKEGISMAEACEILTAEEIGNLLSDNMQGALLTVYLPKFKLEANHSILQMLSSTPLGAILSAPRLTMFDKDVDNASINILQGASFRIDEYGAKSAAVTEGELFTTGGSPFVPKEYTLTIDRPFFFFIKERSIGAYILSGRIGDI